MRHWVTPMDVLTTPDGVRAAAIRYGDAFFVIGTDGRGYRIAGQVAWTGQRRYYRTDLSAMLNGDGQAAGDETVPLAYWLQPGTLREWQLILDRIAEQAVPETGTERAHHVVWEFDVEDAPDAWSAAAKAWIAMTRSGSIATVFTVTDRVTGRVYEVDLTENRVERKG